MIGQAIRRRKKIITRGGIEHEQSGTDDKNIVEQQPRYEADKYGDAQQQRQTFRLLTEQMNTPADDFGFRRFGGRGEIFALADKRDTPVVRFSVCHRLFRRFGRGRLIRFGSLLFDAPYQPLDILAIRQQMVRGLQVLDADKGREKR